MIQDEVDIIRTKLSEIEASLTRIEADIPAPTPEPTPTPTPSYAKPVITSLTRVTGGVLVKWTQNPADAENFDVVIDLNDPGTWRTTAFEAVVPEGKSYMVEARYPADAVYVRSDPVELAPLPAPEPTPSLDEYGISMMYKTKSGGKVFKNPDYQRSTHGGKTRDTFWFNSADIISMELTAYVATTIADGSDDVGFKIMGGRHSSSNPKAGRSLDIGLEAGTGRLYIGKEYPEHPKGDYDIRDKCEFVGTPIGDIRKKLIGFKIIHHIENSEGRLELYIDKDPFINGKPQNNWFHMGSFKDDGTKFGEQYLINQGVQYDGGAGKGKIYLRMDTVVDKSIVYGMTARELDTIPIPI